MNDLHSVPFIAMHLDDDILSPFNEAVIIGLCENRRSSQYPKTSV